LINHELLKEKIVGPYSLGMYYPQLTKNAVVCVTETTSRAEIERFAAAVRKILEKPL
jgi:glycine cleavage system protein P-like pyridoxal-binding family